MVSQLFASGLTKQNKRLFISIILPVLCEAVVGSLFNLVDGMMIGHIPNSTTAVAAIGLCGPAINLVICVSNAFFIGTTATVAWCIGANDKELARHTAWQTVTISILVSLLFSTLSVFGAHAIMNFVCGGEEAYELAVIYYRITAYGFFFQILTINITAMFRGIGVTKIPLLYNLGSSLLNVGLNYVMIFGKFGIPAMGVAGAAWATTIAKICAFVAATLFLLLKKSDIRWKKGTKLIPQRLIHSRMLPIGITAAFEQLFLQSGAVLTSKIISILPTSQIAANQIVSNIEALAWSSGNAGGTTLTTLFGRCMGEGNEKKARSFLRYSLSFELMFAFCEMVLFLTCGKLIGIIFSNDTSIYGDITRLLMLSSISLPFINAHSSISGALRGTGETKAPLIAGLISLWVFRVGLGYLLIHVLGLGIYAYRWCLTADQGIRLLLMFFFYRRGHWTKYLRKPDEVKTQN